MCRVFKMACNTWCQRVLKWARVDGHEAEVEVSVCACGCHKGCAHARMGAAQHKGRGCVRTWNLRWRWVRIWRVCVGKVFGGARCT